MSRAGGAEVPFHVVIPARFASTRLPGKPLRLLQGRPMIVHTLERARESGCVNAVVATDDARIAEVVRAFGGCVQLTSPEHVSGTDRLAEVVDALGWPDDAIVVNLQGDEPCMPGQLVGRVARELAGRDDARIATVATPIRHVDEVFAPQVVKVVFDAIGRALYFSRAPIPFVRGRFEGGPGSVTELPCPFWRHLGLYAYRAGTLRTLSRLAPAALELAESLEQLRALAAGLAIAVVATELETGPGVDVEADLAKAEAWLATRHGVR
jgi:3-deoxy-manno-octulosonate cytidylyltransferase (CMP-KDO synthetase)